MITVKSRLVIVQPLSSHEHHHHHPTSLRRRQLGRHDVQNNGTRFSLPAFLHGCPPALISEMCERVKMFFLLFKQFKWVSAQDCMQMSTTESCWLRRRMGVIMSSQLLKITPEKRLVSLLCARRRKTDKTAAQFFVLFICTLPSCWVHYTFRSLLLLLPLLLLLSLSLEYFRHFFVICWFHDLSENKKKNLWMYVIFYQGWPIHYCVSCCFSEDDQC